MNSSTPTLCLMRIGVAATLVALAGCSSPQTAPRTGEASGATQKTTGPTVGTPMQDVRTEATIQEMEMWYNATKNSQPTRQHEAEAEAAKKAKAKEVEAAKAKAAEAAKAKAAAEKKQP